MIRTLLLIAFLLLPIQAAAQSPARPAGDYPGVIGLEVDVSDTARRIYRVRETIPVAAPGRLTLLYPQWLPGNHAPTGQLEKLAGLTFTGAGGRTLAWRRDPIDLYAFHVEVPAGTTSVEATFQFLTPIESTQGGRIVVSPEALDLQWQAVTLYPKGWPAKRIRVQPSVRLPDGWSHAVALDPAPGAPATAGRVAFAATTLETLVDSPLFAGRYYKRYDLDPGSRTPVHLNVFAETPERAEASAQQIEAHREMVRQADKLFGVRRFDRYEFLLGLTSGLSGIGLEHLRSSENITTRDYFTDWTKSATGRDLLPHEYTHSWNGKHTRPRGLEQADYNTPVDAGLLWVYEGLTDYWGVVLAARSGLITAEQGRDTFAELASTFDNRPGRQWRSVLDTTADPAIAYRRPKAWTSWQRSTDYYTEGALVWLEADTLIRERSNNRRSLDDFARAFFGRKDAGPMPQLYDRANVVAALNAVQPYDWATFFAERIDRPGVATPTAGLERGGYRLTYAETPSAWTAAGETDASSFLSLGMSARRDGTVASVLWDGPAFAAGLTGGQSRIVAVNGLAYDDARIKAAVRSKGQIELIVREGDRYRTVTLDARQGPRYPRLERAAGPARLDDILAKR